MRRKLMAELMDLAPAQRLELADELWDSLAPEHLPPITEEQIQEMERRVAEHRADPDSAIPWEKVIEELRARFG